MLIRGGRVCLYEISTLENADFLIEVFLSKGEQSRANLDFKSYQSNISGRHLMVYGTLA